MKKKIQEQEETIQKYMDMNEKQINDSIEHQQSLLELRNKTRIDIEIESINKLEEIIQSYFHQFHWLMTIESKSILMKPHVCLFVRVRRENSQ